MRASFKVYGETSVEIMEQARATLNRLVIEPNTYKITGMYAHPAILQTDGTIRQWEVDVEAEVF